MTLSRTSCIIIAITIAIADVGMAIAQQGNGAAGGGPVEVMPAVPSGQYDGSVAGADAVARAPSYPRTGFYTGTQAPSYPLYAPNGVYVSPPAGWPLATSRIGTDIQRPQHEHHLRLRVGPAWQIISPPGVDDQSPTKLNLTVDYGYKIFNRNNMNISFLVPLSLQFNTKSFYENSLISFMAGLQFEMRILRNVWFYGYLNIGLGTGFVHVNPDGMAASENSSPSAGMDTMAHGPGEGPRPAQAFSMSQTGLATQMGVGIKLKWTKFDLSIEPISIPIFNAFGPGARGAVVSWTLPIGVTAHF